MAPRKTQAKDIFWNELVRIIPDAAIAKDGIKEYDLTIRLKNNSVFAIKGGDDTDCRRGPALDFLGYDEAQDTRPEDLDVIFMPLLTGKNGEAIISGTKKRGNWFKNRWLQIEKGNIADSAAFWFKSEQNPVVPKAEWDMIRSNLKKLNREYIWIDEYVADPHSDDGERNEVKFAEFDRVIHVKDPMEIPDHWTKFAGLDWGMSHPTACSWGVVAPGGTVFIYDCIKLRGMSVDELSKVLKEKQGHHKVEAYILDPSCWRKESDGISIADRFLRNGIRVVAGKREDKNLSGANLMKTYLKPSTGNPKLIVFNNCHELIHELETLTWNTKNGDDLTDSVRYLLGFLNLRDWSGYLAGESGKNTNSPIKIYLSRVQSDRESMRFDEAGYLA